MQRQTDELFEPDTRMGCLLYGILNMGTFRANSGSQITRLVPQSILIGTMFSIGQRVGSRIKLPAGHTTHRRVDNHFSLHSRSQ